MDTLLMVSLLALAAALAVLAGILWAVRGWRGAPPGEPSPAPKVSPPSAAPVEVNGMAETFAAPQTVATVERSKFALHGLLMGLSENVENLVGDVRDYSTTLDAHTAQIKKAKTTTAFQQVERLLLEEVQSMRNATEAYRQQLDEANAKIQSQETELQKLSVDASTDFLTRIPNRRSFDQRLSDEFGRYMRYGHKYSVVIMDIDHFKQINDTYGHVGGDRMLRAVASMLQEEKRESDFLARFGGEEFALVFPGTELTQALVAAEKLRKKVEATRFNYEGRAVPIQLSAGVAQVDPKDDEPTKTLVRADAALYRAKEGGRNRVEAESARREDSGVNEAGTR
jgi:diguanylate cyclase